MNASARAVVQRTGWSIAAVLLAGCGTEPDEIPAPTIVSATLERNSANVLSATAKVRLEDADSAVVRFGTVDEAALDSASAAATVEGDSSVVPVFGLLPGTAYRFQAQAYGAGGVSRSDTLRLTTDELPADLPQYTAGGSDPSPGYVVFSAAGYGVAIDNTGRIVWYTRLADPATLNFEPQPTGRYYTRPTTPTSPLPWLEIDPLGNVTRSLCCARGLVPRFHDLIAELDGSYWIMCDETRVMDLSASGGVTDAQVTGTVVQHIAETGTVLFEWSPFDHFSIEDLDPADRAGTSVNWTHGNAIDLDQDGNLLISFRSLSEVTLIDTETGDVLWRLGGRANQFELGVVPPFRSQHGARATGPGRLVLLDNLGEADGSRAEQYLIDANSKTAQLDRAYVPTSTTVAQLGGTTHSLPGGRTLVAFGNGGRVQEFDANGTVVWEIHGNPGYVFRATRIQSLYHPGWGLPR